MSTVVIRPTAEPLTIPEARMHLRNPEITSNDAEIIWFIQMAREVVEHKTQRSILTQTREELLDAFPCATYFELPNPPLQSVTSITYLDGDGATQTLATTEYVVDPTRMLPQVRLAYGKTWPGTYGQPNAVTVRYIAGWPNAAQVPQVIKHYMRLLLEAADSNRGLLQEKEPFLTPFAERLLDAHRIVGV